MARVMRFIVDVHPGNDVREQVCFEAFSQLGAATPNRVLHFGVTPPLTEEDVLWVSERIEETLRGLVFRHCSGQRVLKL